MVLIGSVIHTAHACATARRSWSPCIARFATHAAHGERGRRREQVREQCEVWQRGRLAVARREGQLG
jgi:hypothetical protein